MTNHDYDLISTRNILFEKPMNKVSIVHIVQLIFISTNINFHNLFGFRCDSSYQQFLHWMGVSDSEKEIIMDFDCSGLIFIEQRRIIFSNF